MRELKTVAKNSPKRGMSLRISGNSSLTRFFLGPIGRILIMGCALLVILVLGVFTFFYARYSRAVDAKLNAGPFANNAEIFAAPESPMSIGRGSCTRRCSSRRCANARNWCKAKAGGRSSVSKQADEPGRERHRPVGEHVRLGKIPADQGRQDRKSVV